MSKAVEVLRDVIIRANTAGLYNVDYKFHKDTVDALIKEVLQNVKQ